MKGTDITIDLGEVAGWVAGAVIFASFFLAVSRGCESQDRQQCSTSCTEVRLEGVDIPACVKACWGRED